MTSLAPQLDSRDHCNSCSMSKRLSQYCGTVANEIMYTCSHPSSQRLLLLSNRFSLGVLTETFTIPAGCQTTDMQHICIQSDRFKRVGHKIKSALGCGSKGGAPDQQLPGLSLVEQ